MSKYPRDEFDRVPEFSDRSGVHRETLAARPSKSGLGILMGVGILALVVGLFSFLVLPNLTGTPAVGPAASSSAPADPSPSTTEDAATDAPTSPAAGDGTEDGASADPSASASGEAPEEPGATSGPETTGEPGATEEPGGIEEPEESSAAGEPNYAAPISVYNGTGTSGLAGRGASVLSQGGFASVSTDNWTKRVNASVVYYRTNASRATAEEAARVLRIPTVFQTSNIPAEISVVLGGDYR